MTLFQTKETQICYPAPGKVVKIDTPFQIRNNWKWRAWAEDCSGIQIGTVLSWQKRKSTHFPSLNGWKVCLASEKRWFVQTLFQTLLSGTSLYSPYMGVPNPPPPPRGRSSCTPRNWSTQETKKLHFHEFDDVCLSGSNISHNVTLVATVRMNRFTGQAPGWYSWVPTNLRKFISSRCRLKEERPYVPPGFACLSTRLKAKLRQLVVVVWPQWMAAWLPRIVTWIEDVTTIKSKISEKVSHTCSNVHEWQPLSIEWNGNIWNCFRCELLLRHRPWRYIPWCRQLRFQICLSKTSSLKLYGDGFQ